MLLHLPSGLRVNYSAGSALPFPGLCRGALRLLPWEPRPGEEGGGALTSRVPYGATSGGLVL